MSEITRGEGEKKGCERKREWQSKKEEERGEERGEGCITILNTFWPQ